MHNKLNLRYMVLVLSLAGVMLSLTATAGFATTYQPNPAIIQTDPPTPVPNSEGNSSEGFQVVMGTVSGAVSNGTLGEELPGNMEVVLHFSDGQFGSVTADTNGNFRFDNVPIHTGFIYKVSVFYLDTEFYSVPVVGDIESPTMYIPVKIYETTADASSIYVEFMEMLISAEGDNLVVTQYMGYANTSDRLFTADVEQGAFMQIPLPQGAANINLDYSSRHVHLEDGQEPLDILPIPHNAIAEIPPNEIVETAITYQLPIGDGDITVVDLPIFYDTASEIFILTPLDLTIIGSELAPIEMGAGLTYTVYTTSTVLSAGSTLRFEVDSSNVSNTTGTSSTNRISKSTLAVIFFAGGVLMFSIAGFLFWRDRNMSGDPKLSQQRINELIRQIGELDKLHQDGKIDDADHQEQRNKLKSKVAALMKTKNK